MNTFKIFPAVKQSIKLSYKHKILWVFALMISGFSAGSNLNMLKKSEKSTDTVKPDQSTIKEVSFNNSLFDLISYNLQTPTSSKLLAVNSEINLEDSSITSPADSTTLNSEEELNIDEFNAIPKGATSDENLNTSFKNFVFLQAMQILTLTPVEELLPIFKSNLIILGVVAFLGITIAVIVGILTRSWGIGALFFGTKKALDNHDIKLKSLSETGVTHALKLVQFQVLMFFTFLLVTLIFAVFGASPFVFFSSTSINFLVLFGVGVFYLVFFVSFIYISKIGPYFIIFESKGAREAFYLSWDFFKINIKPVILTDFVSLLLLSLVMGVLISIASALYYFGVFLYPEVVVFMEENLALVVPLSLFVGIISIVLALGLMVVTGFLVTFKHILWTKMFFALKVNLSEATLKNSNKMEVSNVA